MIALDTSSLIAYLSGAGGVDVEAVEMALEQKQAVFPPIVLSELLSDIKLPEGIKNLLKEIPMLFIEEGYWEKVGLLRAQVMKKGRKACLADTMIAQSCIDHGISLITRDKDFKIFNEIAGLKLFKI